jgi:hypothetical protein
MAAISPPATRGQGPRSGKKFFSLAEAQRALPLVKRIAVDVQLVQAMRLTLYEQISNQLARTAQEREFLEARFEKATEKLEALIGELEQIGVELKDASQALLDFPSRFEGRVILLCWKAGEERITHWHELDGGYAGRKPVELLGAAG